MTSSSRITAERVLQELGKIGFADIRKAVQWGKGLAVPDETGEMRIANGVAMIDSGELDDQTAAAIAEVAQTRDGIKIKFHDKRAALVDIGRHLGMFVDKHEMSGKDGGPLQVETNMHEVAKLLLSLLPDDR